jgi:sporulation protein YlmC with PRC-barrel domain
MKARTVKQIVTFVATVCCAQTLLMAQQSGQSDQTQPQPGFRRHTPGQTSTSSGQTSTSSDQGSASSKDTIRLSKLRGAEVKSKSGEELGKLQDFVVDRQGGHIKFAIVGKGTTTGTAEKAYPIPWQAVTINSEQEITANVDKQKMQSGPTVSSDYSELNDPDAVVVIYRIYEIQPSGAGETPGGTQSGSEKSRTNPHSQNP